MQCCVGDVRVEGLDPHAVGLVALELGGRAGEHDAARVARPGAQLGQQPRLADARLALDRQAAAGLQRGVETSEFQGAPDQGIRGSVQGPPLMSVRGRAGSLLVCPPPPPTRAAGRRSACSSLSLLIIGLDNTVLNVALPTLQTHFDASASTLQWIVDAYLLAFAGVLLTMGTLGDRFGRKRALQAGLVALRQRERARRAGADTPGS